MLVSPVPALWRRPRPWRSDEVPYSPNCQRHFPYSGSCLSTGCAIGLICHGRDARTREEDAMAKAAMTDEHKAALERGRTQSRAVKAYLAAMRLDRPRKSSRTPESIEARLAEIPAEIESATPINELRLIQERLDLKAELERLSVPDNDDFEQLEAAFIEHAAGYADAKGISYAAWREIGVDSKVLRSAGIRR